jgi:hypothetical protein
VDAGDSLALVPFGKVVPDAHVHEPPLTVAEEPVNGEIPTRVLVDGGGPVLCGEGLLFFLVQGFEAWLTPDPPGEHLVSQVVEEVAQGVVAGVREAAEGALEEVGLARRGPAATATVEAADRLAEAQGHCVGPLPGSEQEVVLCHRDHGQPRRGTMGAPSLDGGSDLSVGVGHDEGPIALLAVRLALVVPVKLQPLDLFVGVAGEFDVLLEYELNQRGCH